MHPDQSKRGGARQNQYLDKHESTRRGFAKKFIPILFFCVFGLFIVVDQVPAAKNLFDRTFRPETWRVRNICEKAALSEADKPEYARIIESGSVYATQIGYYVEKVIVGEMGDTGAETKNVFSCYIGTDGQLVKTKRELYQRERRSGSTDGDEDQDVR